MASEEKVSVETAFLKDEKAEQNASELEHSDTSCGFSIFKGPTLQRYKLQSLSDQFLPDMYICISLCTDMPKPTRLSLSTA